MGLRAVGGKEKNLNPNACECGSVRPERAVCLDVILIEFQGVWGVAGGDADQYCVALRYLPTH